MLEFGGFWMWFTHLFERWLRGYPQTPSVKMCKFLTQTITFFRKKGGQSVMFLKHSWKENRRHNTKNRSNTFCFGRNMQAFRFVILQFWARTPQAQYKKKASIPSCFLNIFGEKTDDTVPKNWSEVIFQLKRASIPFCFFAYF